MAYGLEQFCRDLTALLHDRGVKALPQIAEKLQRLLVDPAFIAATFNDDTPPGKRILFHDPDSDAYVLAHVHKPGGVGKPHSHGSSWAIYGNVLGFTDMTEWRRTNPEGEAHTDLEAAERYRLGPGQARAYGPNLIHSTEHPEKAWVIRVLGTNLEFVPRYRFDAKKDRIAGGAAAP